MSGRPGACPLTTRQIIDEYFIEHRTKLLDIAAFLDRLDRSADAQDPASDFRVRAFRRALEAVCATGSRRLHEVQMILSDPTTEPRKVLDTKSASGAYDDSRERR